ncbi:hypothetical protein [Butyrivibrio sp. VCB2001]|uniref:hypothetical protein n=1 Tax=Butyrivibrio sp. VCB2001 TaxID=1280667 RepID=UPI00041E428D|nr:hypothetical protein [Butyrivibrio sp. VCB2001]
MADVIKGHNTSYARYEELINRRDELKKEAFQYHAEYVRRFGDLILELFRKKIECIRKKKTIEYCQAALNHGNNVDQAQLQAYLEKEMAEFQARLNDMVKEHEAAFKSTTVTEKDMLEIKRIYHRLVKKIHPDINPAVTGSEELMDLWHRVTVAYSCNSLKDLQELEVLVMRALESVDIDDMDIPDIEEKISDLEKEIMEIMETDPYQYKFLLEDSKAVEAKKEDLNTELKTYDDYSKQLEEVLEELLGSGVKITWQMN